MIFLQAIPAIASIANIAASAASIGLGIAGAVKGPPKVKIPKDIAAESDEKRRAAQAALAARGFSATQLTPAGGAAGSAATGRATLLGQ
jgi:hypothetical protein